MGTSPSCNGFFTWLQGYFTKPEGVLLQAEGVLYLAKGVIPQNMGGDFGIRNSDWLRRARLRLGYGFIGPDPKLKLK